MTATLQEMVNATPNGGTLDLGTNKTYAVGQDPTQETPLFLGDGGAKNDHYITIVGDECTIVGLPTTLAHRPTLLVRGHAKLLGTVTVRSDGPDTAVYDARKAFRHCIELAGAMDFESTWSVSNAYGNGYYIGKRLISGHPSRWSKNVHIHDYHSAHMGRQHIAINNLDGGVLERADWTDCARSALDVEPPGNDSGCKNFTWSDSDIRGHFFDAFANLGAGTSDACQDITLDGVRCHGQHFSVRCFPVNGARRQRYTIKNCWSDTLFQNSPLTFTNVDGVTIANITQPLSKGVVLARFGECTGISCDVPYFSG